MEKRPAREALEALMSKIVFDNVIDASSRLPDSGKGIIPYERKDKTRRRELGKLYWKDEDYGYDYMGFDIEATESTVEQIKKKGYRTDVLYKYDVVAGKWFIAPFEFARLLKAMSFPKRNLNISGYER